MKRTICTFLVLVITLNAFCQKPTDNIDTTAINYTLIGQLFNVKLNELRKSLGLTTLTEDAILAKAGTDQCIYMMENDTLTHLQKTANKRTPADRVLFNGGRHDGVGENCLYNFLLKPIMLKNKDTLTIRTYQQAADQVFLGWKNSPGHYKNMIDPSYEVQGIGFAWNKKKGKLFAAQVFGVKPYTYNKTLEPLLSSYSLKPNSPSICSVIETEGIWGIRMANRIYESGGKVYISLQNPKAFEKYFKEKDDMIAIDIVFKDQFTCEKFNRLNGSPYYDGVMLQPVSFNDLFKRNTGTHGRLIAYICDLPREIKGMNYQLNVVLAKKSCFCTYTYPVVVENEVYDLINLQPFWDTIPATLVTDSFHLTLSQRVYFEKGKSEIDRKSLEKTQAELTRLGKHIKSVTLNAYSSIEGDSVINNEIEKNRAAVIIEKLKPYFPPKIKPNIITHENWAMFAEQIWGTEYDYLEKYDHKKIKTMIRDSLMRKLSGFLDEQRYSEFKIEIAGTYGNFSPPNDLRLGVYESLEEKNYVLSHKIQSKLLYKYLAEEITIDYISEYPFTTDTTAVPFFVNLLAAKAVDTQSPEFEDRDELNAMFRRFSSSPRARFNYCIYAVNYWSYWQDTLVNPDKLYELVKKASELAPPSAVNSLVLNYHLAAVSYYTLINDYQKMSNNLDSIHTLFNKVKLDENTAYKLGLYFSGYNCVNWTVELLEPFVATNKDEKFLHLYLAAGTVRYQKSYPQVYLDILDKYIKLYPAEYKAWIEREYQLLREDVYKSRYCALK